MKCYVTKSLILLKIKKYGGYQGGIASMVWNNFLKNSASQKGTGINSIVVSDTQ